MKSRRRSEETRSRALTLGVRVRECGELERGTPRRDVGEEVLAES